MNTSKDCFQKQKGFTILEVMVALAIVGISIGIFFSLIGNSARLRGKIDEHSDLLLIARSKLEESFMGLLETDNIQTEAKRIFKGKTEDGTEWKVSEVDQYTDSMLKIDMAGSDGEESEINIPPKGILSLTTDVEGVKITTISFFAD